MKLEYANIPDSIISRCKTVTVACDIMFVNNLPFLMTISRHIKFSTAELLPNQKTDGIFKAIKRVHQLVFSKRGFTVNSLLMDGQFDTDGLQGEIASKGITLNVVAADEHVPDIERYIRVLKECARIVVNMLPFTSLPGRVVVELIYYCGFWLNSFPAHGGISDTMSPRAIVVGSTVNYSHPCKLEFRTYVQTHEPHDNTMITRTVGALP